MSRAYAHEVIARIFTCAADRGLVVLLGPHPVVAVVVVKRTVLLLVGRRVHGVM